MADASSPRNSNETARKSRRAWKQSGTKGKWQAPLLRGVVRLLGTLPLSVNRALGGAIGRLAYTFNTSGTRVTRINHSLCFPELSEAEREERVKASMVETGRVGTELPVIWSKSNAWLETKLIDIEGQSLLQQYIGYDSGLIVLLPHLGNWELFSPFISKLTPLTALYQPPKQPALESLVRAARERWGAKLEPANRKGVMALFKTLKAGGSTVILPDQVPERGAGAEYAPFYGVPALTMTLVHNLIARTGCRVLMGYALRIPGGFKLVIAKPDVDIYSDDSETSLVALNRSVESCVNACPSQYQWEYKRFKKPPAGMDNPYPKM